MSKKQALIEQAKREFEAFLKIKGLRKTAERFSVIDELFMLDEHIDVESFYLLMRNKNYSISRATIYNTLDLLVECGLAVKHQFREKQALYEQALTYKHHDHLVCNTCGKIKEFSDQRIERIKETIGHELGSSINRHALVFYGDCTIPDCEYKKS